METKRLIRSRSDSMVGGVCGGLGAYLGIDSTIVRLFFVLLAFAEGIGFILYFILWVVVPREGWVEGTTLEENVRAGAEEIAERAREMGEELQKGVKISGRQSGLFIGAALILIGIFYLLDNLNIFWLSWLRWGVIWPVVVIFAGVLLLVHRIRGE
ncbi:MAG: PspC domain-containing protein [Anaerolineales bacterium]|nr:MAG: PspC domain-containing protein [Anaerolineales bacterium]